MPIKEERLELQYGNNFFAVIVYTKSIVTQDTWEQLTVQLGMALKEILDGNTNQIFIPYEYVEKIEILDKTLQFTMWKLFNSIMENSGKDISIGKNNNEEQQTKSPYPPPNKKYEKI